MFDDLTLETMSAELCLVGRIWKEVHGDTWLDTWPLTAFSSSKRGGGSVGNLHHRFDLPGPVAPAPRRRSLITL